MLRKFFHSGSTSDSTAAKKPKAGSDGNRATEFADMVERLERFEGGKNASCSHLRYCSTAPFHGVLQRLTFRVEVSHLEIVASSRELGSCVHSLYGGEEDKHQVTATEARKLLADVMTFRTSSIAPLQTILADIPQLKLLRQHQALAAKWMQAEATSLQKHLGGYRALASQKKAHRQAAQDHFNVNEERTNETDAADSSSSSDNDSNNNADDKHSEDPARSEKPSSPRYPTAIAPPKKLQVRDQIQIMPNHVFNQEQSICSRKKHVSGTRTWNLHRYIKDSMACGLDLADCIQLPDGCQLDEWVAVHVIDFFNEISLLFGTISEFCTHGSCPQMSAGPCYTYLWADGVQQVTPISLPASEYVSRLLGWVERQLDDKQLFPEIYSNTASSDGSGECNPKFMRAARNILKRLFRVYAHMYHNHLQNYVALHAESHLNFCFKRFVLFVRQFDLIEQKELNALRKLIQTLLTKPLSL
ncbi:unnamed protein product [Phytophthora fragariaefolia]|uniref:Unnamed protein product n=1 Tax=Phytophthora fragariaefolia TaxID=1490495 RepID=A0A9W6Y0N4_9STRA|nr:unnamed protein product [Phytophthora fragariaefolia]